MRQTAAASFNTFHKTEGERGNERNGCGVCVHPLRLYIYFSFDSCSAEQEMKYSHLLRAQIYGLADC